MGNEHDEQQELASMVSASRRAATLLAGRTLVVQQQRPLLLAQSGLLSAVHRLSLALAQPQRPGGGREDESRIAVASDWCVPPP